MDKALDTAFEKQQRGVSLSNASLERHVEQALKIAQALADFQPVNARHVLLAVLIASSSTGSGAFKKLASLLPVRPPENMDALSRDASREKMVDIALAPPLIEAYATVERFLAGGRRVWGRDLITTALLAMDPSLRDIASEAGKSLDWLRDQWFAFVTSPDEAEHGTQWEKWWHTAGVPLPAERTISLTNDCYLLSWDNKPGDLSGYAATLRRIELEGCALLKWNVGDYGAKLGDRVFFMRHDGNREGICGWGQIVSEPFNQPVRKQSSIDAGSAASANVLCHFLSEEAELPLDKVVKVTDETALWSKKDNGLPIPPDAAQKLIDTLWDLNRIPATLSPVGQIVANVDSDRVSPNAVDFLDVEREARAFSRLAASKKVLPPLSIGIFGEWGSGKTFFMEKMIGHVDHLSRRAKTAEVTAYHQDIVQIRFNAWHYMETNIWASLVDHIFRKLDGWLRRQKQLDSDKIEGLYERLSTARLLKLEALEALIEARRRRNSAEEKVQEARQRLASAEARKSSVKLTEYWSAVGDTLGADAIKEADQEKIQKAAESLGLVKLAASAKELQEALTQVENQAGRTRLLLRSIGVRFAHPAWLATLILLLIGLPLILPAVPDILKQVIQNQHLKSFVDEINRSLMAYASIFASVAGWIGAAAAKGSRAINLLNTFQEKLNEKLKERKEFEPQSILQPDLVLAQCQKEVEIAETSLKDKTELMEQAQSGFGDTAVTRLNRFIKDKIVNGDYAKHLGIIASIRKDFEELAGIMTDIETQRRSRAEYEEEKKAYVKRIEDLNLDQLVKNGLLTKEEKETVEKETKETNDENLRFFQRIILYIDDLDRCSPEKVVEILQACHLLLFFPLFIVVVAVDARWVSRALVERYKGLLDVDPSHGHGGVPLSAKSVTNGSASPRDYLEKIFHIPYWVRRMQGEACDLYAIELIGKVATDAKEGERKGQLPGGASAGGSTRDTAPDSSRAPLDTVPADDKIVGVSANGNPPGNGSNAVDATTPESPLANEAVDEIIEDNAVDPNPESLKITSHERDFLAQMARFAGNSPRTIKRFINVYRLLRTGLSETTLKGLVGKDGNSGLYFPIIAQLAVVTGAPDSADTFFEVLEQQANIANTDPGLLIDALNNNSDLINSEEWPCLLGPIKALKDKDNSSQMIANMQICANTVKRYSFSARPYL